MLGSGSGLTFGSRGLAFGSRGLTFGSRGLTFGLSSILGETSLDSNVVLGSSLDSSLVRA